MPGELLSGVDAVTYHNDEIGFDKPSLSSSMAHTLTSLSPQHAHAKHPRLGGKKEQPRDHYDSGTLIHRLLLGSGPEIVVVEADDWRTNVAKAARAQAREAGAVPVLEAAFEEAEKTAEILRSRFADHGIVLDGQPEVVVKWTERSADGVDVNCRGMMDHIKIANGAAVIHDLKSTRSAHPDHCARAAESYGYAIQRAAYPRGVEFAAPQLSGRVEFVFVFFELEEPYAVTPAKLSGAFREIGDRRWRRAVNMWGRCVEASNWPGYVIGEGFPTLDPSPWALKREMEQQMRAAEEALFGED